MGGFSVFVLVCSFEKTQIPPNPPPCFLFQGKQFDILEAWSLESRRSELELCFVTLDKLPRLAKVQFAVCEIGIIVIYHRVVIGIK